MKNFKLNEFQGQTFHFIGIGGISMSALAQMLFKWKFSVQGSDLAENDEVEKLKKQGIKVFDNHSENNLQGVQVVVYSSAIHEDNPELKFARENNLTVIKRAELLGMVAESFKTVVAVAGSHGKTTATAMISEIFLQANQNPTLHIGGPLNSIHSNYLLGGKKFFITEACEYMDNYLFIKPDIAVILNIDGDHLDYFKTLDGVKRSFKAFSENIRDGGIVVCCKDDENSVALTNCSGTLTFGEDKSSDIYAQNIREYKPGRFSFDAMFCGHKLGNIELNIMGRHNVYNALASILVALALGIDFCDIKFALENFSGTQRRCEIVGEINGAEVIHDYAHHPAQIEKMLSLARSLTKQTSGKVITVFEPHTFSRTKFLLDDFAKSFSETDHLILAPVYSARENESDGKNSLDLLKKASEYVSSVEYIEAYSKILFRLKKLASKGDIIMILGAGTIENLAKMINRKSL